MVEYLGAKQITTTTKTNQIPQKSKLWNIIYMMIYDLIPVCAWKKI